MSLLRSSEERTHPNFVYMLGILRNTGEIDRDFCSLRKFRTPEDFSGVLASLSLYRPCAEVEICLSRNREIGLCISVYF